MEAEVISWAVTAIVAVILLGFVGYLAGLRGLPVDERPRTAVYDRFGHQTGVAENPDYHENPGEQ